MDYERLLAFSNAEGVFAMAGVIKQMTEEDLEFLVKVGETRSIRGPTLDRIGPEFIREHLTNRPDSITMTEVTLVMRAVNTIRDNPSYSDAIRMEVKSRSDDRAEEIARDGVEVARSANKTNRKLSIIAIILSAVAIGVSIWDHMDKDKPEPQKQGYIDAE